MLEAAIFVIFPFCMAHAAITDLLSMTIANRVSLLLAATFLVVAPLTGMDMQEFGLHLATGFGMLAITFGLFAVGGMGGGDAKLIAATSLWMGFSPVLLQYLLYSAVFGGLLTILILVYRRSALAVFTGHNPLLRNLADRDVGIPYGIALGLGGLMVFPETPVVQWALARAAGL